MLALSQPVPSGYSNQAIEFADANDVALFTYDPTGAIRSHSKTARRIEHEAYVASLRGPRKVNDKGRFPKGADWWTKLKWIFDSRPMAKRSKQIEAKPAGSPDPRITVHPEPRPYVKPKVPDPEPGPPLKPGPRGVNLDEIRGLKKDGRFVTNPYGEQQPPE
jgi:hypothetical protein